MKLSFSILLLVATAATQISAAAVAPRAAVSCIAGSQGKGLGDGYKGYCCDDQSDCIDDCVKGVCVGPVNTKTTTTTTTKGTKTTTTTVSGTPTPGACTPGSKGLGQGDGYNNACCSSSDDCIESCVSGKCNGPVNTKTTTTTTTKGTKTTTTTVSGTPTPGACTPGSKGLGQGDGYNNACCSSSDDCIESCVSGKCDGPVNTKTTTATTTKTKTTSAAHPTGSCTPGAKGKKNGTGVSGACCETDDDCVDTCNAPGVCGVHP